MRMPQGGPFERLSETVSRSRESCSLIGMVHFVTVFSLDSDATTAAQFFQ